MFKEILIDFSKTNCTVDGHLGNTHLSFLRVESITLVFRHCTCHHLTQPVGLRHRSTAVVQAACPFMVMLSVLRWKVGSTLKYLALQVQYFAHIGFI